MYLDFYRLSREPFHITPDPDFLFPSPSHNEALASIVYGVEKRKGFVALTGEVGTGKTTILRAYLRREEGTDIRPIYLFHPDLSFRDLVVKLLRELGMETGEASTSELLERLQSQLIEEYRANRTPVLIIDEAQNMPIETLEQLRMLTNLETSKDKLLQVVLVGQPELEEILDQHSLRQLKQRISVRSIIQPLTPVESAAYVRSRVERAGGDAKHLFSDSALREIVKICNGIPRTINTLCDNSLIAGYGMQQRPVPPKTVREAARDLQLAVSGGPSLKPAWALAGLAAMVAMAAGAYWFVNVAPTRAPEDGGHLIANAAPLSEESGSTEPSPISQSEPASVSAADSNTEAESPQVNAIPDAAESLDPVESLTAEMRSRSGESGSPDVARPLQAAPKPVAPEPEPEPEPESVTPRMDVPAPDAVAPVTASTPVLERKSPDVRVTRLPASAPSTQTLSEKVDVVTRVVQPGDCLSKLISEVYGTENYQSLMPAIMRRNPSIQDPDALTVGLSIEFPTSLAPSL